MNISREVSEDFKHIIEVFDNTLNNMWDRGCFNPDENESDKEVEDFLQKMKDKYMPVIKIVKPKSSTIEELKNRFEYFNFTDEILKSPELTHVYFDKENITYDEDEEFDMPGFKPGYDIIDENKDIVVRWFGAGGDWQLPVAFLIYIGEDDKLHGYIPKDGNCYDKENNCAYDDQKVFIGSITYTFDMKKMTEEFLSKIKGE